MRLSRYFLPVLKETPSEAQIASHRLMLRAGMIRQQAAGIYSWLPLGYRVLRNIERIVHEEQQRAGHIPMLMPTLQPADLWRESGRYDDYGEEMLRIRDRHGRDLLYGPTNEEMITDIFRAHVGSYRDLPLTLYHLQWKFRDEIRPRFGVMRGREFYMKDGYTFDLTEADAKHAYNRHLVSYLRTYERMGLQAIPMKAEGGPIGGDHTHEFLVLAETGESEVFYDSEITDLTFGDREIDTDDHAACAAVLEEFTSRYARTDDTHDEGVFNAPRARGPAAAVARDRGRADLLFRDEVFRADGRDGHGSGRQPRAGPHGVARDRGVAAGGRDHRGQPRRARHRLARGGDAVPLRHRQPQAGRCRGGRRPASGCTPR